jgi:crotonobetainyl-CoA:carnitine CoA-transferase CaiB-like acyl-CoA transferase
MAITGEEHSPPLKSGIAVIDLIAGLECAVGALAALVGRGRVGSVRVDLVEAGVTALVNVLGNHLATGREPTRHGSAHPNIAPYQAFAASDGHLVVAVGNDRQFSGLLDVLGLVDPDGRYASNPIRLERRDELAAWLARAIGERQRDELLADLRAADVPSGPVNSVGEAVAAMGDGWLTEIDGVRLPPSPIQLDGVHRPLRRPPPLLGQHTDEVVAELHGRA